MITRGVRCLLIVCSLLITAQHALSASAIATISSWLDHTALLPITLEPGHKIPAGIATHEIDSLYKRFSELTMQSSCAQNLSWLDGVAPESIMHTVPDFTKDCRAPFVSRLQLPVGSKILFMGDLHGCLHALTRNLRRLYFYNYFDDNWKLQEADTYLVFLGDLVDRGHYGVEVWCTLMKLFNENPGKVFFTRGNHEEMSLWRESSLYSYGPLVFKKELKQKFGDDAKAIGLQFADFCEKMPHALYIESGFNEDLDRPAIVQCCHGGIEPGFDPRPLCAAPFFVKHARITSHYYGFNWSDFTGMSHGRSMFADHQWTFNYPRGLVLGQEYRTGYLADIEDTDIYLTLFHLSGIFRGHQDLAASFKLVSLGVEGLVNIEKTIDDTFAFLQGEGEKMTFFVDKDETVPVFTMSTAREARNLVDEGFLVVKTAAEFKDWRLYPCIYH